MAEERLGVNTASSGRFWSDSQETIGNFAHEITLDLGHSTGEIERAFPQVRATVAKAMRHDRVHRARLLAELAPEGTRTPRPQRCVWVNAEAVLAEEQIDFTDTARLSSPVPIGFHSEKTRQYPGISLNVTTRSELAISCEYSNFDFNDVAANALIVQWAAVIEAAIADA